MNTSNVLGWDSQLSSYAARVGTLCDVARKIPEHSSKISAVLMAFDAIKSDPGNPKNRDTLDWVSGEVSMFLAEHSTQPSNSAPISNRSPSLSNTGKTVWKTPVVEKPKWTSFSFMRKISEACRYITSLDLLLSEREEGYYFVPSKSGQTAELLRHDKPLPQNATRILSKTLGRRVDVFPALVSDRTPPRRTHAKVESRKRLPTNPPPIEKTRASEVASKSFAGRIIDVIRNSPDFLKFRETSTVWALAAGDQLFIAFSPDSACYSITVRQDSKNVSGHSVALCEVNYSIRMPGSHSPTVRTAEGFLYLPLTSGGRVRFTKDSKVVPELSEYPIQKIHLKRATETVKH